MKAERGEKRAEIHESSSGRAVTLIQTAIPGKSLTQPECRLRPGQPLLQPGGVVVGKHAAGSEGRGHTHTHTGEMLQREMRGPHVERRGERTNTLNKRRRGGKKERERERGAGKEKKKSTNSESKVALERRSRVAK